MSNQQMIIGMDPKEPDGTVTIVLCDDERGAKVDMNWREAIGVMFGLHDLIHHAAEQAGVKCEEVAATIDRMFTEAQQVPGGDGDLS